MHSSGRRRVARLVAVVCLLAAACGGTPPPVLQPTAPAGGSAVDPSASRMVASADTPAPPPTGALTGRAVTTDDPAAPIGRARVTLTGDALSEARVAITAEDGSFIFEQLPAGSYGITASASGYAPQLYKQRRATAPPPVVLTDGQRLDGLDISLPPAGVIVGQILDEDGRPFVGAFVDALLSRMENDQASLVSLSSASTDDRGEFRLAGLPAGQYYVSAFDPSFANVGDHTGPLRYTATYYPGAVFVEQATRVSVTPGVEPDVKIVFKLQIVRPAQISGIIASSDKRQLASGAVILAPIHGEGLATAPSDDVRINPDGTFTFRNVAPGHYQIRARAEIDPLGVALFATYRVRVNGRDISNIEMALLPGASVQGTVTYEALTGPAPPTYEGLRVRAPFADGSSFGDALTGEVGADGGYRIRGLMSGAHFLTIEGLEAPWVLKNVLWKGQDITDVAIDVESKDQLEDVRVTVTDAANDVTGTVRDARGNPVGDALVLIIPMSSQFWTRTSRRFGILVTSEDGRYRRRGLPPGEYRVVATTEFDESEIYRKEILTEFVAEGLPLTLDERQTRVLDVGLISLSALGRTSAR